MRSEAQTRWEKGVDPEAAALAATYASQLLAELAGARWTGETEVRAEPAPPPVIAYRPQYASASDRTRDRRGRAARAARRGSASRSATTGRSPSRPGARATCAATSTSSRRSAGSGSKTCPQRCRDGRRCTAGSRTSSGCVASSPTCSSAPGCTRRTPTRCSTAIPIRTRSSCPSRCRRSSASCARRSRSACSARRSTTSTWGTATSRSSRSRTCTCRPARCRRSAGVSAASCKATSSAREGLVEAVFAALNIEPVFTRADLAHELVRRGDRAVGLGGDVRTGRRARRRVERVRARSRRALRARAGAVDLPRRHHVPAACARTSRSSSTRRFRPAT